MNFTGMNQDTAPNVYDFPMREYGIQGRWPSPDPAGLAAVNPTDPQTWNRYAYVRNSPLEFIDPTGTCGDNHPCPPPPSPRNGCKIDGTPAPCGMTDELESSGAGAPATWEGFPVVQVDGQFDFLAYLGMQLGFLGVTTIRGISMDPIPVFGAGEEWALIPISSTLTALATWQPPQTLQGTAAGGGISDSQVREHAVSALLHTFR